MTKKRIIIIAAAGLVSFGSTFAFAWLTTPPPPLQEQSDEKEILQQRAQNDREAEVPALERSEATDAGLPAGDEQVEMKKAMTEKQLRILIYELREKTREYDDKLQGLKVQEQRLQIAYSMIKKDISELNNLRIELASTVAGLKSERDKLLKSRVEITKTEKGNLISIAATYDKMDAASAGKILTNMCELRPYFSEDGKARTEPGPIQNGEFSSGAGSVDDAVKILYYMTERTKAKVLAELVTSEPKLAAVLCQRLKQIVE